MLKKEEELRENSVWDEDVSKFCCNVSTSSCTSNWTLG